MNKFDPLEVRQRRAEQQADCAIAVAAERHVAALELTQRRADEVAPARAPAYLIERLGLLYRVAGLLAPQLVHVLDIQVQQMLGQVAGLSIELGKLVYRPGLVVARARAPQQPQLVIG